MTCFAPFFPSMFNSTFSLTDVCLNMTNTKIIYTKMINYQLYIYDPTKYMKHVQGVIGRMVSTCAITKVKL